MYPNPQDVLPLPARPDIDHYRKLAKDLARSCRTGEPAVQARVAQWVERVLGTGSDASATNRSELHRQTRDITAFAQDRLTRSGCRLSQAQFIIARAYGFASWPKLLHHVAALAGADPAVDAFERAADAIVAGEVSALDTMLASQPELVRARSDREHGATLLHYVSANGVEHYRQRTPPDIVTVARRLLDAGAAVDAEANVYGGGWTTLGLVVTSAHPRLAGVQHDLAGLLLDHGARIDAGIVGSCLANGCPEAAAFMAARGAPVRLEDAAGIGRLDLMAGFLEADGGVPEADAAAALIMAAWYDRSDAVRLLLDHGVSVASRPSRDGQTALHVAAYQGSVELVRFLLSRGAPIDIADDVHGTTPLVWALHAWLVDRRPNDAAYRATLTTLAEAGAAVDPRWIDDDRIRADAELYALLSTRAAASGLVRNEDAGV